MKTARQVAVEALVKVNQDGGYSNLVLDNLLSKNGLTGRDRSFCSALFYGVLERRLTLDAVLQRYSKQPIKNLNPHVREIMRLALCQMLYMDGVPACAAVSESVELTRKMKCAYASGYVNGALRAFLRDGAKVELPERCKDPSGFLSLSYAAPRWLCKQWIADYGEEQAENCLRAALGRPPLYVRVNTQKCGAEELCAALQKSGAQAEIFEAVPNCLEISGSGAVDELPLFAEGFFTVQDISSQLCAQAVDAQPAMRVLDVCAAPGGKSFTMAQWMQNQGELLALDLYPFKAELILSGAKRLGLTCIRTAVGDAALFNPQLGFFDRVLCDVPCSGLGIIRRKPEIRYKAPEDLRGLPEIQYKILETSSSYVKVGGKLTYSTCTLCRAENDEIAKRFLHEHPNFCPAALPEQLQKLAEKEGTNQLTLMPGLFHSDGFFIACFEKTQE